MLVIFSTGIALIRTFIITNLYLYDYMYVQLCHYSFVWGIFIMRSTHFNGSLTNLDFNTQL